MHPPAVGGAIHFCWLQLHALLLLLLLLLGHLTCVDKNHQVIQCGLVKKIEASTFWALDR
jgi:hypothetical protein